jgi:hypothetical protein
MYGMNNIKCKTRPKYPASKMRSLFGTGCMSGVLCVGRGFEMKVFHV